MTAVREVRRRWIEKRQLVEARLDLRRKFFRGVGEGCDRIEGEVAVRAGDAKGAVGELDIVRRGFQKMRCQGLRLLDDLVRCHYDCGAGECG